MADSFEIDTAVVKKERKKERKAASCLSSSFLQFLAVEIASLVHQPQKNVKKMGRIMMK